MSHITRTIPFSALMLVALALLAACTGGGAESAPTPVGLQEGKPTFVYLWNSP